MSALLDQFVEEAGDLLEAAGGALLALERNPGDERAVNDLFRSVHTFKGTSALFDFPALTKLVHVGEDLLDAVREGTVQVSAELVDVQLELLDLLRSWVDAIRETSRLPDDAASSAKDLMAQMARFKGGAGSGPGPLPAASDPVAVIACDWLGVVPEAQRVTVFRSALNERLSVVAIDYEPDADCYFRGEDPLLTCRGVPDLFALTIEAAAPPPLLDDFDPYVCRLRFRILSTAPRAELEHLFRYVMDQVRIVEIAPEQLILPAGSDATDAQTTQFFEQAAALIAGGRLAELRDSALTLLAALDDGRRAASALRWLLAVLEVAETRTQWLLRLAETVAGGKLNLNAPAAAVPTASGAKNVATDDLAGGVIDEQRRILGLPAPDPVALAGRIASVGRALANVAAAQRDADGAARLVAATATALQAGDPQALGEALDAVFVLRREPPPTESAPAAIASGKTETPNGEIRESRRMLKVDQAKVDRLMALIGELVVAKNALPFLARRAEQVHGSREMSREIGQRYSVIDRLAQEMQEAIMEVRLLPVSEVFARFPRLIRDLSRKLDKQIELVLEGEETQADKNIIELLGDPLIHIVRNAADHGIESPEVRMAKGKAAHGTIRLKAKQEGDLVVIEVSDDGRGVDTARVIEKALERGIISADEAARLSPGDAANLIFHPGLSTMDAVSDLSGRGVGMDVVQTSIRDAGGTVAVSFEPDAGTTVRLALPLSMAVVRVMTIETAGTLYGVPIDSIAETVRVDAGDIRPVGSGEAFLLRNTIVPLVRLRRLLRLPGTPQEREAVLVLRMRAGLVGMVVDRFDEHMDIILKPLEGILVGLKGFAGTALLGDGRVLMVLDVKELL
jgi:two-component system chemotaxis sensor kinase CheA